jgi:hypothetical protein
MNYVSFIVKLIGKPEQSFFEDNISVTEIVAKLRQPRKKNVDITVQLSVWGNLAYDIVQYYQINDYIIVEGYISLGESFSETDTIVRDKQVEISVFKIYPFLLNDIRVNSIEK